MTSERENAINERIEQLITKLRTVRRLAGRKGIVGEYHIDELQELLTSLRHHTRKIAKANERIAIARENLSTVIGTLASKPHPLPYYANQEKTLADYVQWCFQQYDVDPLSPLSITCGEKAAVYIEQAMEGEEV